MQKKIIEYLDNKFYPLTKKNWDDDLFRNEILNHLSEHHVMLDIGAGAGIVPQMNFKNLCSAVYGVDLDPRVCNNPYLNQSDLGDAGELPYADSKFDIVFCANVLEHIEDPVKVFLEINRVLKSGGLFFFKTPNKFHYMPLIASITPTIFHKWFNRRRGRDGDDTFPTRYKANSIYAIKTLAHQTGFDVEAVVRIEWRPEYLRFNLLTYLVGIMYERLVNLTQIGAVFRILMIGSLRKS